MSLLMRPPLARCCCCPVRRCPFASNFNINSFFFFLSERELYLIRPVPLPPHPLLYSLTASLVCLFLHVCLVVLFLRCKHFCRVIGFWVGWCGSPVQWKTEKMHNSFYSSRKKNIPITQTHTDAITDTVLFWLRPFSMHVIYILLYARIVSCTQRL